MICTLVTGVQTCSLPIYLRGRALYDRLMLFKPAGLDEYEWAKRAGVNRGYFNDIKEKNTSPRTETLTKVLAVAGKTVADLYLADAGIQPALVNPPFNPHDLPDRKSTRLNSSH